MAAMGVVVVKVSKLSRISASICRYRLRYPSRQWPRLKAGFWLSMQVTVLGGRTSSSPKLMMRE